MEPEAHNFAMRIKHLLALKQDLNPHLHLATYWLHNYSKDAQFLMDNSRIKTLNNKKSFYYHDIICYIKNHNQEITKTKAETETIYQKIIEEGSKNSIQQLVKPTGRNIYQLQTLKVHSSKLYNYKCMTASTQITSTEVFVLIGVLAFKLFSRKVLLINREDNGNC